MMEGRPGRNQTYVEQEREANQFGACNIQLPGLLMLLELTACEVTSYSPALQGST